MAFVDDVSVKLKAGAGGNGCASFRREKYIPRGGPNGGDGGRGGHVVLVCDENITDLNTFKYNPEWRAKDGQKGMGAMCAGRDADDLRLLLPEGTDVYDTVSGKKVAELLHHGEEVILLKGGKGGLGNIHFVSSINRAPKTALPGKVGQIGEFRFELKCIADIGLVGFPNAGKSSLINLLTHTHSKVAPYPFTTLNPQLGRYADDTQKKIVIADIPGIIEGAHDNKGLGHKFLRHIERCKLLLFVIDAAGVDARKPAADFKALVKELKAYDPELLKKPRIVVSNKADLLKKPLAASTYAIGTKKSEVVNVSCLTGEGIDALKAKLKTKLSKNGVGPIRTISPTTAARKPRTGNSTRRA